VNVEGITWHAIVLETEPFAATKALMTETFGLAPAMEMEGVAVFNMPNGTLLELYAPQAVPNYGYNEGASLSASGWTTSRPPRRRSKGRGASCSARSPAWRISGTPTGTSAARTAASTA
jgi:hypothetical protein